MLPDSLFMPEKNTIFKKVKEKYDLIVLGLLFLSFLLFPMILMGKLYYVGGDDTRLYYLFPKEFINNFAVNIISDNAIGGANTGYGTAAHFIPFVFVIEILKNVAPFINTQSLMYGLNYALGFLFFYLFISLWVDNKSKNNFYAKILASVFYVASPFLVGTLYISQLTSLYLVTLMPAMLYYFCRAVKELKYVFSIVTALIFSLFSTTLNTTPWWLPIVITGVPISIYLFVNNKKSFIINTIILAVFILLLNYYWLYHFLNSNINKMGAPSSAEYYSSAEYEEANLRGVMNLTRIMDPLVPVLQKIDYRFKQNFSPSILKNIIFISIITFAGIFASNNKVRKYRAIYWFALASLLLSWFMFSPNFGNWGPDYFLVFVKTMPFGIMFRNMFDKFALPLSFYFAFTLAISLVLINESFKNVIFKKLIIFLTAVVILTNLTDFLKLSLGNQGTRGMVSGSFNSDFEELVTYLKVQDNASQILWLPMTAPNYVSVEDRYIKGNYYSGLSPLRILADRGDYAGRYSFMLPNDVYYGDKIFDLLKTGKYEELAKALQKLNVRYLIVDKQQIPLSMYSYLYDEDLKYLHLQGRQYRDFILGEKIKDFGNSYSLYEINKTYMNDKLFITDDYNGFPDKYDDLKYKKNASYSYNISIENLKSPKKLIFLDSYTKSWSLYLRGTDSATVYKKSENVLVQDWANGWEVDPAEIKEKYNNSFYQLNADGSININLNLYFEPQRKNKFLYIFSVLAYSASFLLILTNTLINVRKKRLNK
jgi:hypothetical protein